MNSRKNFRKRKRRTRKQKGGLTLDEEVPTIGIALVAHTGMKTILKDIVGETNFILKDNNYCIYGTENTIKLICPSEESCNLKCKKVEIKSGPRGGDAQISALIVDKKIQLLIFLKNPFLPQSHYHEINALCRVAEMNNIAVAYNPRTARILLSQINQIPLFINLNSNPNPNNDVFYNTLFNNFIGKTQDYQRQITNHVEVDPLVDEEWV